MATASAGWSRFHAVLLSALRPYEEVRPALPSSPYVFANPGSDPDRQFQGRLGSRSVHGLSGLDGTSRAVVQCRRRRTPSKPSSSSSPACSRRRSSMVSSGKRGGRRSRPSWPITAPDLWKEEGGSSPDPGYRGVPRRSHPGAADLLGTPRLSRWRGLCLSSVLPDAPACRPLAGMPRGLGDGRGDHRYCSGFRGAREWANPRAGRPCTAAGVGRCPWIPLNALHTASTITSGKQPPSPSFGRPARHDPVMRSAAPMCPEHRSPPGWGHHIAGLGLASLAATGVAGHLGWDDDRIAESLPREAGRSWGHRALVAEDKLTLVAVGGPGLATAEVYRRGPRWTGPAAKTKCPTRWSTPRSGSGPPRWKHRRSPFRSSTRSRTSWGRWSPDGSDRC